MQDCLNLGNMDSKRDWGHAKDYVNDMWLMLQQEQADDYVVATNETRTVRVFAEKAFAKVGMSIEWQGQGETEVGIGDPSKAEKKLGWKRQISFDELVERMVNHNLALAERQKCGGD
jgi:GDPmannose 4,6-dehydratase